MTTLLILAGVASLAAIVFWYFGRKPARHRNLTSSRLERLLTTLLSQGYDGGVLFIESSDGSRFLQVIKSVANGRAGLRLVIPNAPWSASSYDGMKRFLNSRNISFTEQSTGEAHVKAFLTVALGQDISLAQGVVSGLANDVLGIDMEREAVASFRNVSTDPNARIGL